MNEWWGVFVNGQDEPVAIFKYADSAKYWGRDTYSIYEVKLIKNDIYGRQQEYWICGAHEFFSGLISIGKKCMLCEADKSYAKDLEKMIRRAYDGMYNEYMYCPWCAGHVGFENEHHDDSCKWKEFGFENEEAKPGG